MGSALQGLAGQLVHAEWAGFHFEDLIFPMFVFIVGVSMVFSLTRTIEREGRTGAVVRIGRRTVLLYLLGILCYAGFGTALREIRLLGVLQRIALAYLFAGLIFCFFQRRGQIIWCVSLLVGYWLMMTFVPVPGVGAGHFEPGQNLANWVDQQYLPLRKWSGDYDPEGLLGTLPAIANCLLGVFAGGLLKSNLKDGRKVLYLITGGVACRTGGLAVEPPVSGDQATLDLIVRFGGSWVQYRVIGFILPGGGCLEVAEMGSTICVDRNELNYNLHDPQFG